MFNPQKISRLVDDRKLSDKKFTYTQFYKSVGITRKGLTDITENGASPKVSTLLAIAKYFNVDMNYFFDMESKKLEIESVSVKMTDGNEYFLRRFEELVAENTRLTAEITELKKKRDYTLPNVHPGKVAETSIELNKK